MESPAPISEPSSELENTAVNRPTARIVVGYAFTSKKMNSLLQPKFIDIARSKGLEFVQVDVKRPLAEQGPFKIILHKLEGEEWSQILEKANSDVIVLDPLNAIERLRNRQSMLEAAANVILPDALGKVRIPKQVIISRDTTSITDEVASAGLKLPLVLKPLVVDGSAKAHQLLLAYDLISLPEMATPMILQEFVNHGGVLFKVFIVGESVKAVRRLSIPDVTWGDLITITGTVSCQRVSSAATSEQLSGLHPSVAEFPPQPLLEMLASELRRRLGLQLFNIDVIRKLGSKDLYYVIDINYFPGYAKMPDYEDIFTDFLLEVAQSKQYFQCS